MARPCAASELKPGMRVPGTQYRVLRRLGSGGMSSVHEVVHERLGRHFVVKLLLSELACRADLVARVRGEWRALARLEHPNIVAVTDAGTTATGLPYFVMERLPGATLASRMQGECAFSVVEAVDIALQVLSGLEAAHALGIVHRDIKPANVFVTDEGRVKLFDFGIAKHAADADVTTTSVGVRLGTPRYMAPEQVRGERVDARADLYAVGLVLFELVCGRHPFEYAKGTDAVLDAHLMTTPVSLASVVPGVSSALSRLVAELLSKEPELRPASAPAAAERLRACAASLPLGASLSPVSSSVDTHRPASQLLESRRALLPWTREWIGKGAGSRIATDTSIGIPWTVVGDVLVGGERLWTRSKTRRSHNSGAVSHPGSERESAPPSSRAKAIQAGESPRSTQTIPAHVQPAASRSIPVHGTRTAEAWSGQCVCFLWANKEVLVLVGILLLAAALILWGVPRV